MGGRVRTGRFTTQVALTAEDEAVEVVVEFEAIPASRGRTDGRFGPKIEPDEPASINVEAVYLADGGRRVELTRDQERSIEADIAEMLNAEAEYDGD